MKIKILDIFEHKDDFCLNLKLNNGIEGYCNFKKLVDNLDLKIDDFYHFSLESDCLSWENDKHISLDWVFDNIVIEKEGFDGLNIPFLLEYLEVSKKEFAETMCVDLVLLQKWIDESEKPKGLYYKVLSLIQENPYYYIKFAKI